ncbi:MAG: hypothetical protein GXP54_13270 [Deltaproteobacteria bacterium]|nr:hypothetical protein [Deltaproteobacteria bacterium]
MYDAGKVIVGIVLFIGVATAPLWYDTIAGKSAQAPKLAKAADGPCVEPKEWMRANHMELLDHWRDAVVREGEKDYKSSTGKTWEDMKLTGTCLKCHDKARFCDKCHDYEGVKPYCWDCHVVPKKEVR